ncbi:outer membrane protein assembly factor [Candidatus Sumerlaeota bacterium]|nr:outer membrane protein assembly factor [Candidatus Sumerlaeota bacterium]
MSFIRHFCLATVLPGLLLASPSVFAQDAARSPASSITALAPSREALPPNGAQIRDIRVEGANRVSPNEILARMELRANGAFDADAYRRDLQSISDSGKINPLTLRIDWETAPDGAVNLIVHVQENPVINTITIVGNDRFSQKTLIAQLDYKIGDVVPTAVRSSTVRNFENFYKNGGYKASKITVTSEPVADAPGAVDILIVIDEGIRVKVRSLVINGNRHFSDFYISTQLTNARGILFFNNYFDESAMEDDLAIVRGMYESAGFLDVKVSRSGLVYNEDKKAVTVMIDVVEGPRYTVTGVRTEGVTSLTRSEIDKSTVELPRRHFNGKRLAKALDRVRRIYGDQGYVDNEVSYRLDKSPENQTVSIVMQVAEAPVVYVGQVRMKKEEYPYNVDSKPLSKFIGWFAPPTKDETVMREVRLKPGQKYRSADEVRTIERLKNLGIFRRVEVNRDPTAQPSVRDAVVNVEQDPNAAFIGAMAGIGESSGPALTVQLMQPNFNGRADRFNASATIGTRSLGYRIGFFDRYLGDSDTSMDTNLYYLTDRYREYRERTLGASTEFGRPLSEYVRGYLRFRAEYVSYSDFDEDETEEDFGSYPVLAVRPSVVYDRRDNAAWATRGYLVGGGIETGMADGFLLKFMHSYEWYKKPFERNDLIYAYEHTVGLMPYDATNIGLSERFFVGGSGSLRGFQYREVGPRDRKNEDLAIGGATRITQRHELRYPFNDFIKGRVFTDFAILERGPFALGTPRMGSGVGVILDFGAITAEVDLAVPVIRKSTDKAQYFHIRVGSGF